MPPSTTPDKGMLMGIPVGGGCLNRRLDLLPGFKALALECQRAQDLPPRFDQVQVGRIRWLIDKLPTRMMDHEQQQVSAMVHLQIVHDRVDALLVCWDLFIHRAQEVHKMHGTAARVALGPAVPCGLPQRSIDIAKGSVPIIDLLLGSLRRAGVHIDRRLARIAPGRDRTHLVNI